MKRTFIASICLIFVIILSACGSEKTIPDKLDWKVQDFEATNQDGETVSLSDLKGKVWIADFIFTSCTSVCPPMTANMVKLQDKLKEADVPVEIVSFSVDPERDTPDVRKKYITERGGDLSNWSFFGDYAFDYVKEISESSFKSMAAKPPEGNDQFSHGTSFFLVNQEGTIVKKYSGVQEVPYDTIVEHAKILAEKE
ncbi:SCO family protein [Virgibacillus oceani]|uniref:Lipoprotein n=1 Tax=Virgibacillus oceani TaxID=1479511 RepID=A0A917M2V8_9BACI|nr:SCO family protein [Virgibacillus oceani]GGG73796.1 lipoprotein [Virgibacillus oceani]